MTRKQKYQHLLKNGWWWHYHDDCWFESAKDKLYVEKGGKMAGFRPKEQGITLEEAFKQLNQNNINPNGFIENKK